MTPEQQQWVDSIWPHAVEAGKKLGVDPRAIIAQAALETGWGKSTPDGNNLFGIKATGDYSGQKVTAPTTEYVDGQPGTYNEPFRAYDSPAASVADYTNVINLPRYSAARGTGDDVAAFARALKEGGYATDPEYDTKLVGIADQLPSGPQAASDPWAEFKMDDAPRAAAANDPWAEFQMDDAPRAATNYSAPDVPGAKPADVAGLSFGGPSTLSSAFDQLGANPAAREVVPQSITDPRVAEQAAHIAEIDALPAIEVNAQPLTLDQKIAYDEANKPGTAGWSEAAAATIPGWWHRIRQIGAGYREMWNEGQEQQEYLEYLRAQTIPEAYKRYQRNRMMAAMNGDPSQADMWKDPAIIEAAAAARMPVAKFMQDWPKYAEMSPEQSFQSQARSLSEESTQHEQLVQAQADRENAIADTIANTPNFPSRMSPAAVGFNVGQMVPDLGAAVGGYLLAGAPGAAAGVASTVFPTSYGESKHEGRGHYESLGIAGLRTLAEAVPEMKVFDFVAKTAKGVGLLNRAKRAGKVGLGESGSEAFTEYLNKAIDAGIIGKDVTFRELLTDPAYAALIGFVPGAGIGAFTPPKPPAVELIERIREAQRTKQFVTPQAEQKWAESKQPPAAPKVEAPASVAPATMPPPSSVGSPVPESAEVRASAPVASATQGTASPPELTTAEPVAPTVSATPPTEAAQTPTTPQPTPPQAPPDKAAPAAVPPPAQSVAPPAPPAPTTPEPTPAPHAAAPQVSTAQEPPAGGATVQDKKVARLEQDYRKLQEAHDALIPPYNALVDQFKAAKASGNEAEAQRIGKLAEANKNQRLGISGRAAHVSAAIGSIKAGVAHQQKMAQEPIGSKRRPSEFPAEKGLYWEKTGPNKWEKRGQFGRSEETAVTDADMQGTVPMPEAVAAKPAAPAPAPTPEKKTPARKRGREPKDIYERQGRAAGLTWKQIDEQREKAPPPKEEPPVEDEVVRDLDEPAPAPPPDLTEAPKKKAQPKKKAVAGQSLQSRMPGEESAVPEDDEAPSTEGFEVEELSYDEAELGQSNVPEEGADDAGRRGDGAAGKRPDAGEAGRAVREDGQREESGRTANEGQAPRVDWRDETAVRDKDGAPLQIWRGSGEETSARDFLPESLGYATDRPSASLGVFFTAGQHEAARYGTARPAHLDLRNPKRYTQDTFPTFDSAEEWAAHARELQRQGNDGVILRTGMGQPDWYVAFHPDQVILDPGIAPEVEEEAPSTEGIEVEEGPYTGSLESSVSGKTGPVPAQPLPGEDTPIDPIRQVAAQRAAAIQRQMASGKTPDASPTRDQKLGRSPYESLWRDMYRKPYDNETPEEYQKKQDAFVLKMQNAPMSVQVQWAKQRLQNYYDFKDVEIDPALNSRDAMDAMLDAYNNLSRQAQVMGQPREAMGFNGDLTLRIKKSLGSKGTLGKFSWDFVQGFGKSTLDVARRADSFTHEWFHALDLNLLMRFTKRMAIGVSGAMNQTRTKLTELPKDIHDAFTEVMRAILLTDAASMQRMAGLTLEAANAQEQLGKARAKLRYTEGIIAKEAEREAKAKEHEAVAEKHKADAFKSTPFRRAADQLRAGTAKAKAQHAARKAEIARLEKKIVDTNKEMQKLLHEKASALVQGSKFADFMQGQQYFSIPAELFARAGESWMGNRIGQQAGTEFLSGSPEYYNDHNNDLMRLVYPNEADRVRIFAAMDTLFSVLAQHQYFKGETVAAKMPQPFSIEKELNIEAKANKRVNAVKLVWQGIAADLRAIGKLFKALRHPSKHLPEAKADFMRGVGHFKEFMYRFYTPRGMMLGLEAKAKAAGNTKLAALIRRVTLKLTNDPGAGDTQQEGMEQEAARRTQANINAVSRIMEQYGLKIDDDAQMAQLYEELVKPTAEVRIELEDYVEFLEEKIKDVTGDPNKVDQLRRLRGQLKATNEKLDAIGKPTTAPQNIREAADAFRRLMDQEYYYNDKAGIKLGYKSNFMHRVYNDQAIDADRPGFVAAATEVYEFEKQRKLRAMNRQLATLEAKLRTQKSIARNLERESGAVNAVRAEMNELRVKMGEVMALDPAEQAKQWLYHSQVGDMFQFDRSTPSSVYTKERVLGPYADIAMRDFQDQNPISILHQYLPMSARRAAYAKRFGAEHEQYKLLREQMLAEGITSTDLEIIDEQVKYVTGTYDPGIAKGFRSAINSVYNTLTMALLPASIFVNLFEPITAALRTGKVRDGLRNVFATIGQVIGTGDAAQMRQIADVLGIMARAGTDTIMQNRLFIEAEGKTAAVVDNFYRATGMQGYTNASRIATMKLGGRYLNTWVDVLMNPNSKPEARKAAAEELRSMGVPPHMFKKFAAFVKSQGNMVSLQQLADPNNAEVKNLYITALHSFVDSIIGNPKASDRAVMAFNPPGKFVMSISAFNYYFQRHVLARFGKRFERAEGASGKMAAAMQFVLPMLTLMAAQMAARMLREFYFDREKYEKRMAELASGKTFFNAIDAAGGTGGFSPIYNWLFKSRYTRDFSSIAMGAAPGFLIDNLQSMYNAVVDSKDPNDTSGKAEREGVRAAYRMTTNTMMPRLLHAIGARGGLAWIALTQATAYHTASEVAEAVVPETANERASAAARERRANRTPAEERQAQRRRERRQRNIERRYGQ